MKQEIKEAHQALMSAIKKTIDEMLPSCTDEIIHSLGKIFSEIKQSEDYVGQSLENPDMIAYAHKPEFQFDIKRRRRTTLGRYIRRNHNVPLPDHVLEAFCTKVMSKLANIESSFKILRGDAIVDAYANAVGGESCMTYEDAYKVELYARNRDKVGLLIYNKDARALIWNTDQDIIYIDRIYPNETKYIELFHRYAIENNYAYRAHNHAPSQTMVEVCNSKSRILTVVVSTKNIYAFPFIDTFHWAIRVNDTTMKLMNAIPSAHENKMVFVFNDCSNGRISLLHRCDNCNEIISEDESVITFNGQYYHSACMMTCDSCRHIYPENRLHYVGSQYLCEKCHRH